MINIFDNIMDSIRDRVPANIILGFKFIMNSKLDIQKIKDKLDFYLIRFYNKGFIKKDPISIPHMFKNKKDIEVSAFLISILSFGRREAIIKKGIALMKLMDSDPYNFIVNCEKSDLEKIKNFSYRMIFSEDIIFFIKRLREILRKESSLEDALVQFHSNDDFNFESTLIKFHDFFFEGLNSSFKTRRHLPSPAKGSTCKRINMFLRWMIRKDSAGVDFGMWEKFSPSKLLIPCDTHVINQARKLSIINHKRATWKTVLEITSFMKLLSNEDPIKYDFALFSLGVNF